VNATPQRQASGSNVDDDFAEVDPAFKVAPSFFDGREEEGAIEDGDVTVAL